MERLERPGEEILRGRAGAACVLQTGAFRQPSSAWGCERERAEGGLPSLSGGILPSPDCSRGVLCKWSPHTSCCPQEPGGVPGLTPVAMALSRQGVGQEEDGGLHEAWWGAAGAS